MADWIPIETTPPLGTVAVLYFPQDADDDFDGLDYRYQLAIYRATEIGPGWHDQGTNHDSFEDFGRDGDRMAKAYLPIHTPCDALTAFARYIAAHEQPPVDPLEAALKAALKSYVFDSDTFVDDDLLTALRARGVTLKEGDA